LFALLEPPCPAAAIALQKLFHREKVANPWGFQSLGRENGALRLQMILPDSTLSLRHLFGGP
jgi:hypothetical protein